MFMRKNKSIIGRTLSTTLEQKRMLQDVIEKVKDTPAFEEKKQAICDSIDVEKSKQGELIVSFV